jgi:2-aminoadipate transaminase
VTLAARVGRMRPSRLRELVATSTSGSMLSLAGGLPPPEAFPAEALAEAADQILRRPDVAALQYAPAEGEPGLIQAIAADLRRRLGLDARAGGLVVTTGSQQAFDLLAKVTLDPGDPVVVEYPTYVGALRALAVFEPTFVNVPVDAGGMDTAHLERLLSGGLRPKLCYVVPNFSNPSGTTMTAERRVHLAELAQRYGFLVVEDDPYGQLRFTGAEIAPVRSHEPGVAYVGSFSKVIAPGLRVGYVLVPDGLGPELEELVASTYITPALVSQAIVLEFLHRGLFEPNLERVRGLLRARRNAMLDALESELDGRASWSRPAGGYFLWLELPGTVATELLGRATAAGVTFVPGVDFGGGPGSARLAFSFASPAEIEAGVARLAALVGSPAAV